jgi:hypothetical protein
METSVTRCGKLITTVVITCYLSGKFFLNPNLRGGSPEKFVVRKNVLPPPPPPPPPARQQFWEKYGKIGKIWHRGNFSPNVVIYETGCGNFP